jgi:hypothetical protein
MTAAPTRLAAATKSSNLEWADVGRAGVGAYARGLIGVLANWRPGAAIRSRWGVDATGGRSDARRSG